MGGTLFWSLSGFRTERDRLLQNVDWLSKHGLDYIRILGTFEHIDPNAPDYVQVLGEFLDTIYTTFRMRAEITCHGGGAVDHRMLAQKIVDAVKPRVHTVLGLEMVNEDYSTWPNTVQQQRDMAQIIRGQLPHLVARSSPPDPQDPKFDEYLNSGPYTKGTVHGQRSYNDYMWKFVRQNWDFKYKKVLINANEPMGPASSVCQCSDPLRLAMDRALGILCGKGAYVLHNANGIYGYPNTNPHGGMVRQANVWETPNAEAIYDAVSKVHTLCPDGIEDWTKANDNWVPPNPVHPLPAQKFWGDGIGSDWGVNKNYAAMSGSSFVCMPCGVLNQAEFKARQPMRFRVYNPVTRQLFLEGSLGTNGILTLPGDGSANTAYIIQGEL